MTGPPESSAADYTRAGPGRLAGWPLWTSGGLSAALYAWLAFRFEPANGLRPVLTFLAVFALLFVLYAVSARYGRGRLAPILALAALFRALLLFAGLPSDRPLAALYDDLSGRQVGYRTFLLYDNDVWRYQWDGHLTVAGVSPYAVPPRAISEDAAAGPGPSADLLADELWWDVLDNVSFHRYRSVYPPLAQAMFALSQLLAPGSVFLWKLVVVVCDLGTCLLLAQLLTAVGKPRSAVLLYAWNPLVLKEFAGSGHVDAVMVLLLTAAVLLLVRGHQAAGLATLGASALAKLASAALVPLFLARTAPRRWPWLVVVGAAGAAPFLTDLSAFSQGLLAYGREWTFNSGPWAATAGLFAAFGLEAAAAWAHLVTKLALLLWLAALVWRDRRDHGALPGACFAALAALVLLSPAVMPWYLLWALPLAVASGVRWWIVFTGLSMLSYLIYVDQAEHSWWLWVEYALLFLAWLWEQRHRAPTAC